MRRLSRSLLALALCLSAGGCIAPFKVKLQTAVHAPDRMPATDGTRVAP
ncbi:hypothetical protein [Stenotrophomonas mori]|uniref:Uncharacterized protein n=1 Tax=Stenotrophomonas mori TaxID=2871096 RepID=A0ABT0SKY7_9GAMM|nr:hypothetical protein [Stenotrophomonas mori]MCL7715791.1 hypothetical protein [Stenotrophomonas mori]